jgi:hypothetical protein
MPRGLTICKECKREIKLGTRTKHLKEVHGIERGSRPHREFFDPAPSGESKRGKALPETEIQSLIMKYLRERCGEGNVTKQLEFSSHYWGKRVILDAIGVDPDGTLYVCECKAGTFLRPSKGIGQLLLYKVLIEGDSLRNFTARLLGKGFDKERLDRAKCDNIRYMLALDRSRAEENQELLRKILGLLNQDAKVDILYL